MATAVLDIDLSQLPPEVSGLERYCRALIVIRYRGQPVGKVQLPVSGGRLRIADAIDALINASEWPLWERVLHDYLQWDPIRMTDYTLPLATIAICTRDRTDDLQRCLEGLLHLPDDGQDILVVDNAPATDATFRLVQRYARVRYLRENRPGLNIARNRALVEARHEIVTFCDDDALPDAGWLRALLRNFCDPSVLCVTGLTMPFELETAAQEWFERYSPFGRGFRRTVFSPDTLDPLAAGRVGAGANMALRRTTLDLIGPFDEALDAGTRTRSGGDTEMFSRILEAGYRIVYDPSALSWHRHRRAWNELRKTVYGYGVGTYAFWTRHLLKGRMETLKVAWKWFARHHLRMLVRTVLRRPNSIPLDLVIAELLGCAAGPWAYMAQRKSVQGDRLP